MGQDCVHMSEMALNFLPWHFGAYATNNSHPYFLLYISFFITTIWAQSGLSKIEVSM